MGPRSPLMVSTNDWATGSTGVPVWGGGGITCWGAGLADGQPDHGLAGRPLTVGAELVDQALVEERLVTEIRDDQPVEAGHATLAGWRRRGEGTALARQLGAQ